MSPVKETYFFLSENGIWDFPIIDASGRQKPPGRKLDAYGALFEGVRDEIAWGEATPGYIYDPYTPERIRRLVPDAKLVAILRHPVERAFSNYLHCVRSGVEPLAFEEALRVEDERIRRKFILRFHYKQKGFYFSQIQRYLRYFDRDQMRIYLYEDWQQPRYLLRDVYRFLGVDESFLPDIEKRFNVNPGTRVVRSEGWRNFLERPNPARAVLKHLIPFGWREPFKRALLTASKRTPNLAPRVHQWLMEEYRKDIVNLQDLIGRDLSSWLN